jgi:hypothetical protein
MSLILIELEKMKKVKIVISQVISSILKSLKNFLKRFHLKKMTKQRKMKRECNKFDGSCHLEIVGELFTLLFKLTTINSIHSLCNINMLINVIEVVLCLFNCGNEQ